MKHLQFRALEAITDVIKFALKEIINGKLDLSLDMDVLRDRNENLSLINLYR